MSEEDGVLEATEGVRSTIERVDGQLGFLEGGVNDTELSKLQVAGEAYRAHLLETGKSYDEEFLFYFLKSEKSLKEC